MMPSLRNALRDIAMGLIVMAVVGVVFMVVEIVRRLAGIR